MTEHSMNHGHGTEFEHEDLSTRGVFVFMIGLAVIGLVIYFIIVGMYSYLNRYEKAQMSSATPLVAPSKEIERFIPFKPGEDSVSRTFKENGAPMLEHDERGQFKDYIMQQETQLNSYGWVNEEAGVAHIPIQQAMDLIVQRGLPVAQQNADQASTKTAQAATKKPGARK